MRKNFLSLALALTMCLGLTVPAFAANGTTVASDPKEPLNITFDGYLRTEYVDGGDGKSFFAVYVVKDGSSVYVDSSEYAVQHGILVNVYGYSPETGVFWVDSGPISLGGDMSTKTWTADPAETVEDMLLYMFLIPGYGRNSYCWMCESDFARIAPKHKGVPGPDSEIMGTVGPNQPSQPTDPVQPAGSPQVSGWAKEQVNKAAAIGLVPDRLGNDYRVSITRAQFAATAVKLYEAMSGQKAPAAGESPFTDTSDPAVIQAQALGIVSGVGDGKFAADALVTRQEAATMLSRVYTKLGGNIPEAAGTAFADNDKVSGWARDAVAFMADQGIVGGVGNNRFDPLGNASIEQALVIALRMYDNLK